MFLMPQPCKSVYISGSQTGYNISTVAAVSNSNFRILLFVNAPVSGNSSSAAMITGTSWKSGSEVRIINANTITGVTGTTGANGVGGAGGTGGTTTPANPTAGSAGGTGSTGATGGIALQVSSATGVRIFLNNTNGSIIGGVGGTGGTGGGGGGGGGGYGYG